MNCKPGDLAIVIRARCPENIGKVVTVIRRSFDKDVVEGMVVRFLPDDGPSWVVMGERLHALGLDFKKRQKTYTYHSFRDSCLRPIRDQPGEDESLTWAGKPADLKTPEAA